MDYQHGTDRPHPAPADRRRWWAGAGPAYSGAAGGPAAERHRPAVAADVAYRAPGGVSGQGKAACAGFFAGWFAAFPDAYVEVHARQVTGDVAVEEGTFTGTHNGVLPSPAG